MAEIVNLKRVKKARARADAQAEAVANRAKHGRTRPEKIRDAEADAKRNALLDGARKDT
ncbi:DUF4169 family protein [Plastoroseomonas arctica]|uniref:DUF4169 family protein n=1 Tax=Plastoroseomonas arctica TaxID=1509237 RepID=A0AAF1K3G1_9PROT|nr:DUF4169 family protein [Plastoroseomonas arctica]MBR0655554.1 DUF4169 family protein [Plastoroseomonas arctica]